MNPNHNLDNAKDDASDSHSEKVPTGVVVDDQGNPYRHENRAYQKLRQLKAFVVDHIQPRDRLMIVLTGIIAISTVAQYRLSSRNNESTSKQVDRLLIAADRVDDAAESFSRSASGIDKGVLDAGIQLQDQAKKMDAARKSSEKNSTDALQATIDNFRQEQRPWLGFQNIRVTSKSDFDLSPNAAKGLTATYTFTTGEATATFINTGKTPATIIGWNGVVHIGGWDPKTPFPDLDKVSSKSLALPFQTNVYTPGASTTISLAPGSSGSGVDTQQFVLIIQNVTYLDIWNQRHVTKLCIYLDYWHQNRFTYCPVAGSNYME